MKYLINKFIKIAIIFLFLSNTNLLGQHSFKEKNLSAGKFGIGFEMGIPLMSFTFKYNSTQFWFLSAQMLPGDGSGFNFNYSHYTFTFGTKLYENRYQTFSINTSYSHIIRTELAPFSLYSRSKVIKKHTHHLCLGMQYESNFSRLLNTPFGIEDSPIFYNIGLAYIFGKTNHYPFDNSGSYFYQIGIIYYFNTEDKSIY